MCPRKVKKPYPRKKNLYNAYHYGQIECKGFIKQKKDSTRREEFLGHLCLLQKFIYDIREAGRFWGLFVVKIHIIWDFKKSCTDEFILMLLIETHFILIANVVEDLEFLSNLQKMLSNFKARLLPAYDLKFVENLKSFIGWKIEHESDGLLVCQGR